MLKGWFLDLALYRQVTLEIRQMAVDNLENWRGLAVSYPQNLGAGQNEPRSSLHASRTLGA